MDLDTEYVDNWNGHAITNAAYFAQFAGWYLAEGVAFIPGTAQTGVLIAGISGLQNSVATPTTAPRLSPTARTCSAPVAADLVQLNPSTSDTVSLFAYQTLAASVDLHQPGAYFTVQWVALPTTSPRAGLGQRHRR